MTTAMLRVSVFAAAIFVLTLPSAKAAFHVMQIEQVIGDLVGDPSAQAIQLRMRSGGQTVLSSAKIWAWDAAGANRILLLDITGNVSSGNAGDRILLATSAFTSKMNSQGGTFSPDFTLATAIPASYLSAGRVTFEDNAGSVASAGTIYWSVAWGGSAYTGSNTGSTQNDVDGNFGPAFGSSLPRNLFQGIRFTGAAAAASTSNSADYAFTANPATVTKNNGTAFIVVPEPGTAGLLAFGALALSGLVWSRRRGRSAS